MDSKQLVMFQRFHILAAPSIIDLVYVMNTEAPFGGKLVYMGENKDQPIVIPDVDIEHAHRFVAVFDMQPQVVLVQEDFDIIATKAADAIREQLDNEQNDGSDDVSASKYTVVGDNRAA